MSDEGPAYAYPTARLTERVGVRLLLWSLAAAWFLAYPLQHPDLIGNWHDWNYFYEKSWSAWRTVADFGQYPQWDPYYCGGITVVGNLQNAANGPLALLNQLFGVTRGIRIGWFVLMVVGMEGVFQYARHHKTQGAGALLAALVFAFSGRFVSFLDAGQTGLMAFLIAPWLLLCLEKGFYAWRWAVGGGIVTAVLFLEGGAVPLPFTLVCVVALTAYWTVAWTVNGETRAQWYRPALTLAVIGAIGLGLSAFALLPRASTILEFPRAWERADHHSLAHIHRVLFMDTARISGSSFIGPIVGVLAVLGLLLRDKVSRFYIIMALIIWDLSMGHGGLVVYKIVKALPVLENIRHPHRFTIILALILALAAGRTVVLIEQWISGQRRLAMARVPLAAVVAAALMTVCVWQVAGYTRPHLERTFQRPTPELVVDPPAFRQSKGNRWLADVWPAVGLGTLACFEEQPFPMSPRLRGDLPQEEYLQDASAGTVTRRSWSPHEIVLDVEVTTPATILVNQNAHRGWSTDVGERVDVDGLLAVRVPAGTHVVTLSFFDPLFGWGLVISFLTLAGLIVWARRARRRRLVAAAPSAEAGADGPE